MFKTIRKISPMVRAVGTMGAVAAVVGGITFAQIPSNTVKLTDNTLTSGTAALAIGATNTCPTGDTASTPGMSFTNLQPTVASGAFTFCLQNTGNVPLNLTINTPTSFLGSAISPNDVTFL